MPRTPRSEVTMLLQEARAIEMLVNEAEVEPGRLQDYWALSADLINVVADIEAFQLTNPDAGYDNPELLMLRRRTRDITSRLAELMMQ